MDATDMNVTSSDEDVVGDVVALLDGVADLPLAEQAAVFEAVHARLADRLSEQDA